MDVAVFLNKWLHLLSVTAVFGGIVVAVLVLVPALRPSAHNAQGSPADADQAGAGESAEARAVWRRFGMVQGILWFVVLATGFYNYYLVSPNVNGHYHMFLGMKM